MNNIMLKLSKVLVISGVMSAITAISALSPALATGRQVQLKCVATFVKEFTQVPFITNSTQKDIPAGTTLHWQAYWAGNPTNPSCGLSSSACEARGVSTGAHHKLGGCE